MQRYNFYRHPKTAATAAGLAAAYQGALFAGKALHAYRGVKKQTGKFRSAYRKALYKPNPSRYPRRMRPIRAKTNVKSLAKDVTKLKRSVHAVQTIYTKKSRSYNTLRVNTNATNYVIAQLNADSVLSGVIDSVKYFNPAAPGTLVNVDLTSPTYQQKVMFNKSYISLVARNNYSVPCYVDIYFLTVKKDCSIDPDSAIANSFTDMTNGAITSAQLFPSDAHDFNDVWKIAKHKRKYLEAGQQLTLTGSCPEFFYDVSLGDSDTASYMKYFHGSVMLVRVEGVLGHGSTSGYGVMPAGVDILYDRIHKVTYSGGVGTEYIEVENNTAAISGTHQCSQLNNEQAPYSL